MSYAPVARKSLLQLLFESCSPCFYLTLLTLKSRKRWSAVARGAVLRLLHDEISRRGASTLNQLQLRSLESLPRVTSRKSRFSYGIVVHYATDMLEDYDDKLDTKRKFSDGVEYTPRMEWYLTKVSKHPNLNDIDIVVHILTNSSRAKKSRHARRGAVNTQQKNVQRRQSASTTSTIARPTSRRSGTASSPPGCATLSAIGMCRLRSGRPLAIRGMG